MRIVFVIFSLAGGGAERVTSILANHFSATGHDVTIATLSDVADAYPLDAGVRRVRIGRAGISRSPIQSIVRLCQNVLAVRRLLAREEPHAALGMMTTSSVLLALAGGKTRTRLIGTERTYAPGNPLPRFWEWLRRRRYKRLDLIIAQTATTAEWIARSTGAQVAVISNPWIPPPAVPPFREPGEYIPTGSKVVLAVGSLSRPKRFDILLEAFAVAAQSNRGWFLVIAGEGPLRQSLQSRVEQLGLSSLVAMPGRVGNIADWYRAADIFALSSELEGFPNALLEAMAAGCAVVARDCPTGPGDLIQDGINGVLVPLGDESGFARALGRLMSDAALRDMLGDRATEVRETYRIDRISKQWLKAIEG